MQLAGFAFAFALALGAPGAHATDVNVIGLFPGKAVVVINRGTPHTMSVGESTSDGVRLVSVDRGSATVEVDGKRERLEMGQHFETAAASGTRTTVTLPADSRGQFVTGGQVNGAYLRFMVDTGATYVSIPVSEARRLGIDLAGARRGATMTANGPVTVYKVNLDSVTVGGVTLYNVEATVHPMPGMDVGLLGMSFLNRMEMRREGETLTLTKRY
ncbi:MAG TPA: TIGR02281 family clan AA aspartic protease [Usitatibacter sp.]|jgi:aspartyl protease family protein|nr:TIGR02281 family clan AA aspartic protease [Usitatibacter sp.]